MSKKKVLESMLAVSGILRAGRRRAGILLLVAFCFSLSAGCGSKARLSAPTARDVLTKSLGLALKKESVQINNVSQITGDYAVVEATIKTALKYEQVNGRWVLREIRIGDRGWEDIDLILEAVRKEKTARTRDVMTKIAAGLERYRSEFGQYPQVEDYQKLSDLLTPKYVSELIRLDAWSNPFLYHFVSKDSYKLISMGADGKEGTPDDIIMVNGRFQ